MKQRIKAISETILDYLLITLLGFSLLFILMIPNLLLVGIIGFFISIAFLTTRHVQ